MQPTPKSTFLDSKKHLLILDALPGIALIIGSIASAYAALKWYDLPIRKLLAEKFIYKKTV